MAEFESPQSRNEAILQNILGAENSLLPPESRIETLLQQLLASLGGSGDSKEFEVGYKILNKQNILPEEFKPFITQKRKKKNG